MHIASTPASATLRIPPVSRRALRKRSSVDTLERRVMLSSAAPTPQNALAYNAGGNLHVAYYDAVAGNLKYIVEPAAGAWSEPATVDASSPDVGRDPAIAIDPAGRPGIAYHDAANLDLK